MSSTPNDYETVKDYLLGLLPENDAATIESRLLTDREFYDELSIVEDDLIDRYLGGTLSDTDRLSFESHFVSSPERKQKIRFARAFRKYASNAVDPVEVVDEAEPARIDPARNPSLFGKSFVSYATAAVILIVAGTGLFLIWRSLQSQTGKVLAVELTPVPSVRDAGDVKQINLASDVKTLRLQLTLPANEHPSYEAVLRDASFRIVQTVPDLKAQTINGLPVVIADFNADPLAAGDYRVHLGGATAAGASEIIATFSFVVRK